MSRAEGGAVTAVVVATYDNLVLARSTVRSASTHGRLRLLVVDLDDVYRPVADEQVVSFRAAVSQQDLQNEAATAAATLEPEELGFYAGVVGASQVLADGAAGAVVLGAGVHVLSDLGPAVADAGGMVVVPFADADSVVRRTATAPVRSRPGRDVASSSQARGSLFSKALYTVRTLDQLAVLRGLAANWRVASSALDTFAVAAGATVETRPSLLVSAWRAVPEIQVNDAGALCVNGAPVRAVDLTGFDAHRPWLLDTHMQVSPSVLLSDHPALVGIAEAEAVARRSDEAGLLRDFGDVEAKPPRSRMDPILRAEARRAERAGGELPDVLGVGGEADVVSWALDLVPKGDPMPVARYLAAARESRGHLRQTFREVPGADWARLARWAIQQGAKDPALDTELTTRGAEATLAAAKAAAAVPQGVRPQGVNLVGYLAGQLGIGESARLVDDALQSVGIETSAHDVGSDIQSRQGVPYRRSERVAYDTSLICVNAIETPAMVPRVRSLIEPTRVIGMWYWEMEEFPAAHHAGFDHVDEVWVATDFMRDAIAKHAGDTPVRTVTPPLPQASDDPGVVPERFGIPLNRPWFLFTFDFLSLAPRKNPYGLVDAFTRAFGSLPMPERPVLVIKTINADRYPAHAERLRLEIGDRSDVLFIDAYLDHAERHVLVAHCSAYVSLHKAEGLGLTVAEAMAWGKPVITTAYGGVMQFCNERNSFLVDWARGHLDETAGPYIEGTPWAEPDLDHAAKLMRGVVEDPARAAVIGAQAADDIRNLHTVDVAGSRMREVLGHSDAEWRAKWEEASARREARLAAGRAKKVRRRDESWRSRAPEQP